MAQKSSPEWSSQAPRREAQKANLCPLPHKNTSFGGFFANLEDLGGRFGGRKKHRKSLQNSGLGGSKSEALGRLQARLFRGPKSRPGGALTSFLGKIQPPTIWRCTHLGIGPAPGPPRRGPIWEPKLSQNGGLEGPIWELKCLPKGPLKSTPKRRPGETPTSHFWTHLGVILEVILESKMESSWSRK